MQRSSKVVKLPGDGSAWFRIRKSHPDPAPDPLGLVLSSLNGLFSLTCLDLRGCNIGEGVIPDYIGCCLYSLERLILSGNNFFSLPTSIRFLSKLRFLDLSLCERLQQLPDLSSKRSFLLINVDDCTPLRRLSDPSKLSEGANVYDFTFSCLNCFRLAEEEGWINRIFAMIMRLAPNSYPEGIVWPGSEIPKWFSNQNVGDSITVELPLPPPPQSSCSSDWAGIALCVVFEDSEYLRNQTALVGYDNFKIQCLRGPLATFRVGHLRSQHLCFFYLSRHHPSLRDVLSGHRFSFEVHYCAYKSSNRLKTSSNIKECGARLLYERDLEEFSGIFKIPKPNLKSAFYA